MAGQKILKAESTKESNKLVGAEVNENGSSDINIKTIIAYASNMTVFKTNVGVSISKYKKATATKIA